MGSSEKFWDKIAEKYAAKPVDNEAVYQKKLQITQEYFHPDMNVLEFGCGTGSTAIVHAPHVKHIHALDISSKMLEIAQGKADAAGITNITFERKTFDEIDVPEQSVDMVLGLSILHLLDDKDKAIAEAYKWLKPGGLFVSSTVCLGEKMWWIKLVEPFGRLFGLMPMVKVFKAQALLDSMISAGFSIDHQWQPGPNTIFIVAKKAE